MSWCGSVCDYADETFVDPVEDLANEAVEWADENMVDPIEDAAAEFWDYATSGAEELWENVEEFGQALAQAAEKVAHEINGKWDEFTEKAGGLLSDLLEGLEDGWNRLVNTLEEWGQWVKEQVDTAVEWLKRSADAVADWFVEELIPWVVSLIRLPWVIAKLIGGLIALATCWLASKFTEPEEVKVIKAITDKHPRVLEDFRIARLPVEQKYVVFSDIHMYPKGDFNFYESNGNANIHRASLAQYAALGYHVIDNGDIEDFWMRDCAIHENIADVADNLPYPYHYEAYTQQASLSACQAHAVRIFLDNVETYALIDNSFVAHGKYTRAIGNHDDVWDSDDMLPIFDFVYRTPVVAHDYVLLDNTTSHLGGQTEVVIAHGHQSDIWNMELCNWAGKAITDFWSTLTVGTFGLTRKIKNFYREKSEWEADLRGSGFNDELHRMEGFGFTQSLDEVELYEELEGIYGNDPVQPHLILGHTHDVKDEPGVPDFVYKDQWNWLEYSNCGTTGMWEGLVICLELEYPAVRAVAWYAGADGSLQRDDLNTYRYGDVYLK